MKYFEDEDQSVSFFHLYCLNVKCKGSIYQRAMDIEVPFDVDNLTATHICPCCDQPLVSTMDMEIKKIMAQPIRQTNRRALL